MHSLAQLQAFWDAEAAEPYHLPARSKDGMSRSNAGITSLADRCGTSAKFIRREWDQIAFYASACLAVAGCVVSAFPEYFLS